MKIQCPHCKYVMKIENDRFGKRLQCPVCEGVFCAIEKYHNADLAIKTLGVLFFVLGSACFVLSKSDDVVVPAMFALSGLYFMTKK